MLALTIIILCLLAMLNYRLAGRSALYPPVIFCGIWAADFVQIWLLGDFFYPLSNETLFIVLGGALTFSIGSGLVLLYPRKSQRQPVDISKMSSRLLNLLVWLLILSFPFYVRWLVGLVAERGVLMSFLGAARSATLEESNQGLAYSIFFNLATLSVYVALLAFREREGHRLRLVTAITLAFTMNLLTGAKAGVITLLLNLVYLSWIQSKRVPWKFVAVTVLLVILAFGVIQFYVQFGGPVGDSIGPLARSVSLYTSGPIIGFDRVIRDPAIVPHSFPFYIAFSHLLKNFGVQIDERRETGYVGVGPGMEQNAFGMYYAYLDLGMLGMILAPALMGLVITLVYQRADHGGRLAQILYACLASVLLLSPVGEFFLTWLNFLTKLCLVIWMVYKLPAAWSVFNKLMGRAAQAQLADYRGL